MVLRSLENYFVFVFVLHIEFGLRYNVVVKKVNSLYSEEKNCCPYWLNKAMHKLLTGEVIDYEAEDLV